MKKTTGSSIVSGIISEAESKFLAVNSRQAHSFTRNSRAGGISEKMSIVSKQTGLIPIRSINDMAIYAQKVAE